MSGLINIAIKAVRASGKIALQAMDRMVDSHVNREEFCLEVARQIHEEIVNNIQSVYPDCVWFDESKDLSNVTTPIWIISPLNSLINYFYGYPNFAISLAVQYKQKIYYAVVCDPLKQEIFWATDGDGAYLNNHRMRVSATKENSNIILMGTNHFLPELNSPNFQFRMSGVPILDLLYVAAGRLDACSIVDPDFVEVAAGILMVKEAGGLINDKEGVLNNHLLAGTPRVFKSLAALMKK